MNYQKASFWRRLGAALLDGIIVGIGGAILGAIVGLMGTTSPSVTNGISMLISIAYYIATYMNMEGRTIGKKMLNIQVIKKDGTPMTDPFTIIIRDVVGKFISAAVLLIGYIWMLFDKNSQTWHDKIAGTYVVYTGATTPNEIPTMPQQPIDMTTEQNHAPGNTNQVA